jgi:hypothetical protein
VTRVIVADGCQQVDSPVTGRRYYARGASAFEGTVRGGVFDMHPADARMAVAMGGAIVSEAGTTRRGIGFRCPACDFGSFTRQCGRCGAECTREGARASEAVEVAVDAGPQAEEAGDPGTEEEAGGVGEEGGADAQEDGGHEEAGR